MHNHFIVDHPHCGHPCSVPFRSLYDSRAANGTQEAIVVADAGRQKVPVVVTDVYVGQVRQVAEDANTWMNVYDYRQ